jgi:hypothetical protein
MIKLLCLLTFLFISSFLIFGQRIVAPRLYSEIKLQPKKDSLMQSVGKNKGFLKGYELISLVALTHFPELKDTKILFKSKSINSTMQAKPKGMNVFRRKGKRKYVVVINTINPKVPLDSISFNAKIGVLGHELAHIIDYESKNFWQIIGIGLRYGNKKYRAKFERATDQRTLDYGLKWQSYDFSTYVFKYNQNNTKYLEYKKKVYMTPEASIRLVEITA